MAEAAEEWRSSVAAAAAAPKPARYAEVRYERLLADPRARTRELFEFLDIDASDHLLERVAVEAGTLFNVDPGQPDVGAGKWRSLPAHMTQRWALAC